MEFKILSEKNNELFGRKEIEALAISRVNPSREEVLKVLSEKFLTPSENIKIKNIRGRFGIQEFKVIANIYDSKEFKDAVELKKKKEIEAEKKTLEADKSVEVVQ